MADCAVLALSYLAFLSIGHRCIERASNRSLHMAASHSVLLLRPNRFFFLREAISRAAEAPRDRKFAAKRKSQAVQTFKQHYYSVAFRGNSSRWLDIQKCNALHSHACCSFWPMCSARFGGAALAESVEMKKICPGNV